MEKVVASELLVMLLVISMESKTLLDRDSRNELDPDEIVMGSRPVLRGSRLSDSMQKTTSSS